MTTHINKTLVQLDMALSEKYGRYASYSREGDPVLETYGDSAANEVDRLLDRFCHPSFNVLDLGCGAGFTLCRLAPKVNEIWGFDQEPELLEATGLRIVHHGLTNAKYVHGNVAEQDEVRERLPNDQFDLVYSRRGPNVNAAVLRTMKLGSYIIQEVVRGTLGVMPLFGREPSLPEVGSNPHELIGRYSEFDLVPVSVKDYFFDVFYRDESQLIRDLQGNMLWNWTMPRHPYEEPRDRSALDLYVRYNMTSRGIRVSHRQSVYLFRRTEIVRFPAIPQAKRMYSLYD